MTSNERQILGSALTHEERQRAKDDFSEVTVKEVRLLVKKRTGFSVALAAVREYLDRSLLPHWSECE